MSGIAITQYKFDINTFVLMAIKRWIIEHVWTFLIWRVIRWICWVLLNLCFFLLHVHRGQSSDCPRSFQIVLCTARASISGASSIPASTPSSMRWLLLRSLRHENIWGRLVSPSFVSAAFITNLWGERSMFSPQGNLHSLALYLHCVYFSKEIQWPCFLVHSNVSVYRDRQKRYGQLDQWWDAHWLYDHEIHNNSIIIIFNSLKIHLQ